MPLSFRSPAQLTSAVVSVILRSVPVDKVTRRRTDSLPARIAVIYSRTPQSICLLLKDSLGTFQEINFAVGSYKRKICHSASRCCGVT